MKEINTNNNIVLDQSGSFLQNQVQQQAPANNQGYLKFKSFAKDNSSHPDALVKFVDPNKVKIPDFELRAADADLDGGKFWVDKINPIFRRPETKAINNNIRSLFAEALKDEFGDTFDLFQALDEQEIDDMKLEDFIGSKALKTAKRNHSLTLSQLVQQTKDGKTGRPLSSRRINAINYVLEKHQVKQTGITSESSGGIGKTNLINVQDKIDELPNNNDEGGFKLSGGMDNPQFTFVNANKQENIINVQPNEQLNIENKNIIEVSQNKLDELPNERPNEQLNIVNIENKNNSQPVVDPKLNEQKEIKIKIKNQPSKPKYIYTKPLRNTLIGSKACKNLMSIFNTSYVGAKTFTSSDDGTTGCKDRLNNGKFTISVYDADAGEYTKIEKFTEDKANEAKKAAEVVANEAEETANKAEEEAKTNAAKNKEAREKRNEANKRKAEVEEIKPLEAGDVLKNWILGKTDKSYYASSFLMKMLARISFFGVDLFEFEDFSHCSYYFDQNNLTGKTNVDIQLKVSTNAQDNKKKDIVLEVSEGEKKVTAVFTVGGLADGDMKTVAQTVEGDETKDVLTFTGV